MLKMETPPAELSTLERIERLKTLATCGPWVPEINRVDGSRWPYAQIQVCVSPREVPRPTDMTLIADMFNHLDEFIAVVRAAEKVLDDADPRGYGDLTENQWALKEKVLALTSTPDPSRRRYEYHGD